VIAADIDHTYPRPYELMNTKENLGITTGYNRFVLEPEIEKIAKYIERFSFTLDV
jgi:hypothetical protein